MFVFVVGGEAREIETRCVLMLRMGVETSYRQKTKARTTCKYYIADGFRESHVRSASRGPKGEFAVSNYSRDRHSSIELRFGLWCTTASSTTSFVFYLLALFSRFGLRSLLALNIYGLLNVFIYGAHGRAITTLHSFRVTYTGGGDTELAPQAPRVNTYAQSIAIQRRSDAFHREWSTRRVNAIHWCTCIDWTTIEDRAFHRRLIDFRVDIFIDLIVICHLI